ncbi:MAG: PIG-L family deacetylase [Ignavibacteriaceae bacterium]|nr:PIG-L family deacetylase [Ignavibacteriaceae bacterium]
MNFDRVLILSPHTDDAELGCGGYITKLISENKTLLWVVFSTAEESLPDNLPPDTLVKEFEAVMKSLNLKKDQYRVYNFKVRQLPDNRQEILELLNNLKNEFHPSLVIGPSLNDYHQDHAVIANEMVRAFKTTSSIISYELPWNHLEFRSQFFVKLDEENIIKKISLLNKYQSQMYIKRHYFTEDFIKGLALTRGAQINHKYAEAFDVIRMVI